MPLAAQARSGAKWARWILSAAGEGSSWRVPAHL